LYREALEVYNELWQQKKDDPDSLLLKRMRECEYAIKKQSDPEPVRVTKLDSTINNLEHASFGAFAMNNELTLYFTSSRFSSSVLDNQPTSSGDKASELLDRVCIANRKTLTSPWNVRVLADKESSQFHEGVLNVSPDGQFLFIFRGNNEIFVQDLRLLEQTGKANFVPLERAFNVKVSNKQHISSLSMSADGHAIYLCIDGGSGKDKKGYGGYDIWYTTRNNTTGVWSELINMGPAINTAGNEVAISVLPDGKTLFFSSDGLPGIGGYDIYRSTYNEALKKWGKPVHLGYPINTPNNDVYYNPIFDNPKHAYYSAGRPEVADAYDVYFVSYYGEILSNEEKEARRRAYLTALAKVRPAPIKSKKDARLLAKKKYTTFSEKDTVVNVGKKVLFGDIQFSKGKTKLLPNSYPVLDVLYYWMNWHTGVRIRISGYTDNTGSKASNLKLSRARAQSVANYLIKKGIDPARLDVKGYGRKQPIASNKTVGGRALNRRVEFRVIAK
jgi:outer membrane protein OmpA-like peptidoglycan-associated protein